MQGRACVGWQCLVTSMMKECMLFDLNRFGLATYKYEAGKIVNLAWPMFIAQIAQVGVGVVDTVMAGRYGAEDLAAVALGTSIFMTFYISLMGVVTALNPMLSQLFGAQKITEISKLGSMGLWVALILGVLGMLGMWALIRPLNDYFELSAYVESVFAQFLFYVAFALPFALVYRVLHAFASSLNRPKPIMWFSLMGLILSIPVNYVLIYGKFGLPELGGVGCAFATVFVFALNTVCLWLYIRFSDYFQPFGRLSFKQKLDASVFKNILFLGIPIGLSFFIEVSLFTFIAILIANLGVEYVASQQVVINISSLVYMVPQSLGAALSVCVGYAVGSKQMHRARYIAGVGLTISLLASSVTVLLILIFKSQIVSFYTSDAAVLVIATNLLIFNAIFQLPDAMQTTATGALRGYKVTRLPMVIHGIAFWGFGLCLGYVLCFHFNMGIYGFWTALIVSLSLAAIAFIILLSRVSQRFVSKRV